ncbi:thioesterase family protein [Marinactinospora thermotolerans]|uniref:Thioesterase superfamily n=1 Tax=Marinactinospora thermotolerans DSM 45154 TaxID=1122192 RepID=A0A1T4SCY0_9ACTN|nr:thioesterase [Marinactinospora thermotolerans]SKA26124.1 Thioesterase superfamily [Marinactinospora thermotolerans DSM 45154]
MTISTGLHGRVEHTVSAEDTAVALGSGDVPVLGTPRAVALVEAATVAAVRDHLEQGRTSVGTRVDLAHLAPSSPGVVVVATALLREVAGGRLVFDVELAQDGRPVAKGTVERVVVDRERFLTAAR